MTTRATSAPKRRSMLRMSESDAARSCASMFVRKGIPEGDPGGIQPGEFEVAAVDIDDEGQYVVTIRVAVGNLDVELASTGRHTDQAELDSIHADAINARAKAVR